MSDRNTSAGVWVWVGLIVAVVATVVLLPSAERPYDLESARPNGYLGLRLLVEEYGSTVEVVSADDVDSQLVDRVDVVLVPAAAGVSEGREAQLGDFADAGGRVVLGSGSETIGVRSLEVDEFGFPVEEPYFSLASSVEPGECTMAELFGLDSMEVAFGFGAPTGLDLAGVADGGEFSDQQYCFSDGRFALVTRTSWGQGEVINLATPDLLTNALMGAPEPEEPVGDLGSNAVVAEYLLGLRPPVEGEAVTPTRIAVVTSGFGSSRPGGDKTLSDFMSDGVRLGLWQVAIAGAIYLVYRGRRHGRVVLEPQPVSIAGSAFVNAVGGLFRRQGGVDRAAETLRRNECRALAQRYGLPVDIDRRDLAGQIAQRTGRNRDEVTAMLFDPIDSEAALVALAQQLDALRQEAQHV